MNLPFFQMSKNIKDSLRNHLDVKTIPFITAGPTRTRGDALGNVWHKLLRDTLKEKKMTEYRTKHTISILELGIEILNSNFYLYGFMYSESELSPEVYFWQGEADAIGWYYNKKRGQYEYVIVDWRVKRDLLHFWVSDDTFGMYLHQGLLYAKLLQVLLKLDYLPSVLIAPISDENECFVQLGLFSDYPDECKKLINDDFCWHGNVPESLSQTIYAKASLFDQIVCFESPIGANVLLRCIFRENATVGDLLEALGPTTRSLTLIPDQN